MENLKVKRCRLLLLTIHQVSINFHFISFSLFQTNKTLLFLVAKHLELNSTVNSLASGYNCYRPASICSFWWTCLWKCQAYRICFRESSSLGKAEWQIVSFVLCLNKQMLQKEMVDSDKRAFSRGIRPSFSTAVLTFGYFNYKAGMMILLTVFQGAYDKRAMRFNWKHLNSPNSKSP